MHIFLQTGTALSEKRYYKKNGPMCNQTSYILRKEGGWVINNPGNTQKKTLYHTNQKKKSSKRCQIKAKFLATSPWVLFSIAPKKPFGGPEHWFSLRLKTKSIYVWAGESFVNSGDLFLYFGVILYPISVYISKIQRLR